MQWVGPGRFKTLARQGKATSQMQIRKDMQSAAVQIADRTLRFTISTSTPDREDDVIEQGGWDLKAFLRNPVVLFNHFSSELPIGRCTAIGLEDGVLKATVEYVPADMPVIGPLADAVFRMNCAGFMSATSVGFRPLEWEIASDRADEDSWFPPLNYKRQELLEFSNVTLPCNPEALIEPDQALPTPLVGGERATIAEVEKLAQAVAQATRTMQRRAATLAAWL